MAEIISLFAFFPKILALGLAYSVGRKITALIASGAHKRVDGGDVFGNNETPDVSDLLTELSGGSRFKIMLGLALAALGLILDLVVAILNFVST